MSLMCVWYTMCESFGGVNTPPQCQFTVALHHDMEDTLIYPENLVVARQRHNNQCELLMPYYLNDIGLQDPMVLRQFKMSAMMNS